VAGVSERSKHFFERANRIEMLQYLTSSVDN
jgi:hypothetical protein